jgi:transcriptional regulator
MYLPPHFKSDDAEQAARIMRGHPFASLVTTDDEGFPFVSHLPLHLEAREGRFTLLGHCARANPQWRHLQARPAALVTFLGPHAYQSPSIYPDLQRVPSWNYVAVHCRVQATMLPEPVDKDRLLKALIGDHEPAYARQWQQLPQDFTHKLLQGIAAFQLEVTRWDCKLKLNQHRPESHVALRDAYAKGNEDERELGQWMERLGLSGGAR